MYMQILSELGEVCSVTPAAEWTDEQIKEHFSYPWKSNSVDVSFQQNHFPYHFLAVHLLLCSDFKLLQNLLTRILPAASWEHETAAESELASPSGAGLFLSSQFINRFTKSNTLLLLFITSHTAMLAHTLSPIQLVHIWPEGIFGDIDLSHYSRIFYKYEQHELKSCLISSGRDAVLGFSYKSCHLLLLCSD